MPDAEARPLDGPDQHGYAPIGGPRRAAGRGQCRGARAAVPLVALLLGVAAAAVWASAHGLRRINSTWASPQGLWIKWPAPFNSVKEHCGLIEDDVDYQGPRGVNITLIVALPNIGSPEMCCSACAGYPNCTAWTWGKKRDTKFLTDTCFLKKMDSGLVLRKLPKHGVVSGLPSGQVRKQGVVPARPSRTGLMDGVNPRPIAGDFSSGAKCPGSVIVDGHGPVALVNAGVNVPGMPAKKVEVMSGDLVVPHMGGRTYFAQVCTQGAYDGSVYAAINLLGKTLRYTTDVSGTGCGCNAALYLTSMQQNKRIGKCKDYYCDAMSVCGVPCAEIDIQEANQFSWFSTLHAFTNASGPDTLGVARGYGGSLGEPPRRDFASQDYGPGGLCVDTSLPFQVAVSFPTDAAGTLTAFEVTLSQAGKSCPLSMRTDQYNLKGRNGLAELGDALRAGMTPVISYWSSKDMLWMDGLSTDGRGPCVIDAPKACPEYVRFFGFSIEPIMNNPVAA